MMDAEGIPHQNIMVVQVIFNYDFLRSHSESILQNFLTNHLIRTVQIKIAYISCRDRYEAFGRVKSNSIPHLKKKKKEWRYRLKGIKCLPGLNTQLDLIFSNAFTSKMVFLLN